MSWIKAKKDIYNASLYEYLGSSVPEVTPSNLELIDPCVTLYWHYDYITQILIQLFKLTDKNTLLCQLNIDLNIHLKNSEYFNPILFIILYYIWGIKAKIWQIESNWIIILIGNPWIFKCMQVYWPLCWYTTVLY